MPHRQNPASSADGGLKKTGESSDNEMPRPSLTAVAYGRLCQSIVDTGRIDRIVLPVTAVTLNLVELGEVVATRDKLMVPIWTAWQPRLAVRFFRARGPWVKHMERVLLAR